MKLGDDTSDDSRAPARTRRPRKPWPLKPWRTPVVIVATIESQTALSSKTARRVPSIYA